MKGHLGRRLRALFRHLPLPPEEPFEMGPDPEWDELLAWAEVANRAEPEGGKMETEKEDWSAAVRIAKQKAEQAVSLPAQLDVERAEWEAAIARAQAQAKQAELDAERAAQEAKQAELQAQQAKQAQLDAERAEWEAAIAGARAQSKQEVDAERAEWEAAIAGARAQSKQEVDAERTEWDAAIQQAKQLPAVRATPAHRPPTRPQIDQREWEERIARARRQPTPVKTTAAGQSLRDRLERLAARVSPPHRSAPVGEEEDQWRAAIARAKTDAKIGSA
jgi:colicin import membrane protein